MFKQGQALILAIFKKSLSKAAQIQKQEGGNDSVNLQAENISISTGLSY